MMQTNRLYLVRKIIPKYGNMDLEQIVWVKKIQAWLKTSLEISGCITVKKMYQVNFLGIVI